MGSGKKIIDREDDSVVSLQLCRLLHDTLIESSYNLSIDDMWNAIENSLFPFSFAQSIQLQTTQ